MRKVKRSTVKAPKELTDKTSVGRTEREEAIRFFAKKNNRNQSFKFAAYKNKAVKDALNGLFHFKCAYCESDFSATAPVDVEHYRPKSAVVIKGVLTKPGYYWLAADWKNLLPSCIDCNRARTQEFPRGPDGVAGKANLFPIANEDAYATKPDQEKNEDRLLLDPCRDTPETHLEFLIPASPDDPTLGLVRPAVKRNGRESDKGIHSIKVYGLNRRQLLFARRDRLISTMAHIENVKDIMDEINARGTSKRLMRALTRSKNELARLASDKSPYVAPVRKAIATHLGKSALKQLN